MRGLPLGFRLRLDFATKRSTSSAIYRSLQRYRLPETRFGCFFRSLIQRPQRIGRGRHLPDRSGVASLNLRASGKEEARGRVPEHVLAIPEVICGKRRQFAEHKDRSASCRGNGRLNQIPRLGQSVARCRGFVREATATAVQCSSLRFPGADRNSYLWPRRTIGSNDLGRQDLCPFSVGWAEVFPKLNRTGPFCGGEKSGGSSRRG